MITNRTKYDEEEEQRQMPILPKQNGVVFLDDQLDSSNEYDLEDEEGEEKNTQENKKESDIELEQGAEDTEEEEDYDVYFERALNKMNLKKIDEEEPKTQQQAQKPRCNNTTNTNSCLLSSSVGRKNNKIVKLLSGFTSNNNFNQNDSPDNTTNSTALLPPLPRIPQSISFAPTATNSSNLTAGSDFDRNASTRRSKRFGKQNSLVLTTVNNNNNSNNLSSLTESLNLNSSTNINCSSLGKTNNVNHSFFSTSSRSSSPSPSPSPTQKSSASFSQNNNHHHQQLSSSFSYHHNHHNLISHVNSREELARSVNIINSPVSNLSKAMSTPSILDKMKQQQQAGNGATEFSSATNSNKRTPIKIDINDADDVQENLIEHKINHINHLQSSVSLNDKRKMYYLTYEFRLD